MISRSLAPLIVLLATLALGCTTDSIPSDGGTLDGATSCASDGECDDGLFCNGFERCQSGFCAAGSAPCGAGTTCDEALDLCTTGCAIDADGDGAIAIVCGGDDCDDDDPRRHPGALEVCDAEHLDEDCDPSTVGDRDEDEDGSIDARCCNVTAGGELRCGNDCDDTRPNVNRTASEVCDDVDNDCDGNVDEGVSYLLWPDADRDSFGDAAATPERRCGFFPGYALIGGDCDDADPSINPGLHDVCNGADDDCDENVDEGAEDLCRAAVGVVEAACLQLAGEPAPRCVVTACEEHRLDCDLDPSTGCEANFCTDLAHCGACGGYRGACDYGICRDGRCAPSGSAYGQISGRIVRDRDGAPIAGATISRLRDCTSGDSTTSAASGAYTLTWAYHPPFQHFRTEAPGYVAQVDPYETTEEIRLLETAELEALLAMSPVPVDRRLGIVVVDSRQTGFNIVEPVAGTYEAPAIPNTYFAVTLPDGRIREVFVNVRPGTARVRFFRAGDSSTSAECNDRGPSWSSSWNAPVYHDVVVSSAGIVHLRFGWCTGGGVGG